MSDRKTTAASEPGGERDWLEKLARLGYASRGVIYLIIGGLALLSAFGQGGETTDSKGAIQALIGAPGGRALVLLIALGLIGYSAWRLCQAIFDADGHGRDLKAWVIRGSLLVSAVTHFTLALWAGALGFNGGGGSGSSGKESMVASVMAQPYGKWLVGVIGLAIVGAGIAQFAKGWGEEFEKRFTWSREAANYLKPLCNLGLYARGVVFAIMGGFVIYAAVTASPSNAGGLAEALDWIRSQAFGPWLLALVAAGLFCFGVYSIVAAIYRRVHTSGSF